MRHIPRICNYCNQEFVANRKNQIYCRPECRSDFNNDKLKVKLDSAKNIEELLTDRELHKNKFSKAVRIVELDVNHFDEKEILSFEGRRYKKQTININPLKELGISLRSESVSKDKKKCTAIYFGELKMLCFKNPTKVVLDEILMYKRVSKNEK